MRKFLVAEKTQSKYFQLRFLVCTRELGTVSAKSSEMAPMAVLSVFVRTVKPNVMKKNALERPQQQPPPQLRHQLPRPHSTVDQEEKVDTLENEEDLEREAHP
jgi:hypothetical protein